MNYYKVRDPINSQYNNAIFFDSFAQRSRKNAVGAFVAVSAPATMLINNRDMKIDKRIILMTSNHKTNVAQSYKAEEIYSSSPNCILCNVISILYFSFFTTNNNCIRLQCNVAIIVFLTHFVKHCLFYLLL